MKYFKPLIGLEMHVELSTKSKMFCQCDAAWQKYEPNENTCPVCLGLPGALPVPNKKAVKYTIKIAQALGCTINQNSHFDRKHYFYPDLAKAYQISQYDEPIGINGKVSVYVKDEKGNLVEKSFRIHRVHLEEDTGKLIHTGSDSIVDFNRGGVPLVEIVTEADFDSSDDVKAFLQEIHTIITYLDVSHADMEKGSMRLEPNISVRSYDGEKEPANWNDLPFPKYKVEVKNINSFNFVKKAIDFEVKRHIELLKKGETPIQETRGWDDSKSKTFSQRSKEDAHDYRYFPEPDIPPMKFEIEYISNIFDTLPELPIQKVKRYVKDFGIRLQDAIGITRDVESTKYFELVNSKLNDQISKSKINIQNKEQAILNALLNKKISSDLDADMFATKVIEMSKPKETDLSKLSEVISKVIASNEKSVTDYKSGKTNAIMFLVGQVMREMKGQADATTVRQEVEKRLV
ncbi:MAG: Asp-tRNA(Asn)/Glu-tRNA(Gln) amidotransferase subunit GatB [Patescibacteria group bacterium]